MATKSRKITVSAYENRVALAIAYFNKKSASVDKPTTATAVLKEAIQDGLNKALSAKGLRTKVVERLGGKKK